MRFTKASLLGSLVLPFTMAACEAGPPAAEAEAEPGAEMAAPDPAAITAAIDLVRAQWKAAYDAKDAAAIAALYTEDATMIDPDGVRHDGRLAIQQSFLPETMGSNIQLTSTRLVVGTDIATEIGEWTQTVTANGQETQMAGKYAVTLKKLADGSWKIVQGLTVVPAPPAPTAGT